MPHLNTRYRPLCLEPLERRELLHAGALATATLVTSVGDIDFEFFDTAAPGTVNNFLNYVKDGDFVNSIFHRLVPNFVLQGGGFTASTDLFPSNPATADASRFAEVPTDPPIENEFGISNTRGTVAMAKLGGDPDSATSQYFINLVNNAGNLDNQNGGFTVFARVVDMTVVDQIAQFQTTNFSSIFPAGSRRQAISAVPFQPQGSQNEIVRVEQVLLSAGLVHGDVFLDVNQNGLKDVTEGGRGGVVVYDDTNNNGTLDGNERSVTTDDLGAFHFAYEAESSYRLRLQDAGDYGPLNGDPIIHTGTIDRALNAFDRNFATVYTGRAWYNDQNPADVDGVNGLTPLDALLVINELTAREFSDATTGTLPPLNSAPAAPQFLDADDDGVVSPLDALVVVNALNDGTPAAALSGSTNGAASVGRYLETQETATSGRIRPAVASGGAQSAVVLPPTLSPPPVRSVLPASSLSLRDSGDQADRRLDDLAVVDNAPRHLGAPLRVASRQRMLLFERRQCEMAWDNGCCPRVHLAIMPALRV